LRRDDSSPCRFLGVFGWCFDPRRTFVCAIRFTQARMVLLEKCSVLRMPQLLNVSRM